MKFKTYKDVTIFLEQIPKFSSKGAKAVNYSLQNIQRFCEWLGNPQNNFKSIHVAGTNGKGSTCRLLATLLKYKTEKVALFTSPHLMDYRERFRINGAMIDKKTIITFFNTFGSELQKAGLTYFEISTILAFWWFSKQRVDVAVIETGLGGRLDATNIITPMVSVITTIARDHEHILGRGLETIAREKAGIIKKGVPVITGLIPQRAQKIIEACAENKQAPVYSLKNFPPGKLIPVQCQTYLAINAIKKQNLALALVTLSKGTELYKPTSAQIVEAVKQYRDEFTVTGCFERLDVNAQWYFDGAHNKQALRSLVKDLQKIGSKSKWIVIFCMMDDKVTSEVLNEFLGFKKMCYYSCNGTRTALFSKIKSLLPAVESCPVKNEATRSKFLKDLKAELVIFTGSFYFYETVKQWVGQVN